MATKAELVAYLVELKAARTAVLQMKSYNIGGMTLTRADEKWIASEIQETEYRISLKSRGNTVTPMFLNNRG